MEKREDKGKKYNAYSQLMTGQKKTAAIDHFDWSMQWDITKVVIEYINKEHNVIKK